eukprot:265427-Chlamydomonas_euryale.AAC.5
MRKTTRRDTFLLYYNPNRIHLMVNGAVYSSLRAHASMEEARFTFNYRVSDSYGPTPSDPLG